jgi:hypothetical protein
MTTRIFVPRLFPTLLLSLGLAGQAVLATPIVVEPFNYSAGNLGGHAAPNGRNWTYVGTAGGTVDNQVVAGNLAYNGLATPATPGAMAAVANAATGTNIDILVLGSASTSVGYFSFLLNVTSIPTTAGQIVAGLGHASSSYTFGNDVAEVYIR